MKPLEAKHQRPPRLPTFDCWSRWHLHVHIFWTRSPIVRRKRISCAFIEYHTWIMQVRSDRAESALWSFAMAGGGSMGFLLSKNVVANDDKYKEYKIVYSHIMLD